VISADAMNENFATLAAAALNRATSPTMTASLLFSPDATVDVGLAGATRPRDLFLARDAVVGRNVTVAGLLELAGAASFGSTLEVAGNASVTGTLGVTGATTLGTVSASGGTVGSGAMGASTYSSVLTVGGGYLQLPANTSGSPASADCDEAGELGRMAVGVNVGVGSVYVCLVSMSGYAWAAIYTVP
jgi:hypothetical protein